MALVATLVPALKRCAVFGSRIFPVSALNSRRKAKADELPLEDRWYPIQVKQKDKAGRPDIDAFEAVMARSPEG